MTIHIFGTHDSNTHIQFEDVASRAAHAALMADGHVGFVMPIGGVAAYRDMVSLAGVGVDIACGNCAIQLDMTLADLGTTPEQRQSALEKIADAIQSNISFGMGRSNKTSVDHDVFESDAWTLLRERAGQTKTKQLFERAKQQLGTVGGGNHYVDVFSDENGSIWIGVHFGSRGLGFNIANGCKAHFLNLEWGEPVKSKENVEGLLSLSSSLGQDYWTLMHLAGQYAYAGREWVCQTVASLIGGREIDRIHNHHNFAWKETHYGEEFIVVRKGATPAFPGQRGFVGGSMGDCSVILTGSDTNNSLQQSALYSTVHGAGRVMSRTQARGKIKGWGPKARIVSPGAVSWDMVNEWLNKMNVIRRGGGLDESPHVYRRLPDVLTEQHDTITIQHTLTPLIVVMAGANEFDPYKD